MEPSSFSSLHLSPPGWSKRRPKSRRKIQQQQQREQRWKQQGQIDNEAAENLPGQQAKNKSPPAALPLVAAATSGDKENRGEQKPPALSPRALDHPLTDVVPSTSENHAGGRSNGPGHYHAESSTLDRDDADERLRHQAVSHLQRLAETWWTQHFGGQRKALITVVPFGSWRLSVHRRGTADLDLLILWHGDPIDRTTLFRSWQDMLQADARMSHVQALPAAYTPIIKCCFVVESEDGPLYLPLDLLFGALAQPDKLMRYLERRQPSEYYHIEAIDLVGQDLLGVRSLNGVRFCQYLLQHFCTWNEEEDPYRIVLRAVKEWALQRGLYSNLLGLLGGPALAILVAYVYQHSPPDVMAETLLERFFSTFAHWRWPSPIMLTETLQDTPPFVEELVEHGENGPSIPLLQSWNPSLDPRDGYHLMPILTPIYPTMNSSYNVGRPQLRRFKDELLSTHQRLRQFWRQQRSEDDPRMSNNLSTDLCQILFQPNTDDFFQQHEQFLQVTIMGSDNLDWFRFVERALRNLIVGLETPEVEACPMARFFHCRYCWRDNVGGRPLSVAITTVSSSAPPPSLEHEDERMSPRPQESHFFIGLRILEGRMEAAVQNLRYLTAPFLHTVHTWEGRTRSDMEVTTVCVPANELPEFVFDEGGSRSNHSSLHTDDGNDDDLVELMAATASRSNRLRRRGTTARHRGA